jgi:hypothetical protein
LAKQAAIGRHPERNLYPTLLAHCPILKMEVMCSSETSANCYHKIGTYHNRAVETPKSHEIVRLPKPPASLTKILAFTFQHVIITSISSAGIPTGYGLDGPDSIPGRTKFFSSTQRPDRIWIPPSLLPNSTGGSFPGGKTAEA